MNEDFWLVVPVALVWALLALVYALAPWGFGLPAVSRIGRLLLWRKEGNSS